MQEMVLKTSLPVLEEGMILGEGESEEEPLGEGGGMLPFRSALWNRAAPGPEEAVRPGPCPSVCTGTGLHQRGAGNPPT